MPAARPSRSGRCPSTSGTRVRSPPLGPSDLSFAWRARRSRGPARRRGAARSRRTGRSQAARGSPTPLRRPVCASARSAAVSATATMVVAAMAKANPRCRVRWPSGRACACRIAARVGNSGRLHNGGRSGPVASVEPMRQGFNIGRPVIPAPRATVGSAVLCARLFCAEEHDVTITSDPIGADWPAASMARRSPRAMTDSPRRAARGAALSSIRCGRSCGRTALPTWPATLRYARANGLTVAAQAVGHGATSALSGGLLRTSGLRGVEVRAGRAAGTGGCRGPMGHVLAALSGTGQVALSGELAEPERGRLPAGWRAVLVRPAVRLRRQRRGRVRGGDRRGRARAGVRE